MGGEVGIAPSVLSHCFLNCTAPNKEARSSERQGGLLAAGCLTEGYPSFVLTIR